MQTVSVRTLTLLLLLLASVLAHQYVALVPAARADAIWLATGDPNDPDEQPQPECSFAAPWGTWLDDEPNEPSEPIPERAGGLWHLRLAGDDDPNEPGEPMPERA
jgi:hypothetical protein